MSLVQSSIVALLSLLFGGAIFLWIRGLCLMMFQADRKSPEDWDNEGRRRLQLREQSIFVRYLEPLFDDLVEFYERPRMQRTITSTIPKFEMHLVRSNPAVPLSVSECMALATLQGILFGLAFFVAAQLVFGVYLAALGALLAVPVLVASTVDTTTTSSKSRIESIRSRLPYAVDLMALIMAAGTGFRESLGIATKETRGHPLGEELARVEAGLNCGEIQSAALESLRDRLQDSDLDEFVLAINNAERLGAPLSNTLLSLAESLRNKRSLGIEAAVERANTNARFPAFLFFAACLLTIVAPFIISMLENPVF